MSLKLCAKKPESCYDEKVDQDFEPRERETLLKSYLQKKTEIFEQLLNIILTEGKKDINSCERRQQQAFWNVRLSVHSLYLLFASNCQSMQRAEKSSIADAGLIQLYD